MGARLLHCVVVAFAVLASCLTAAGQPMPDAVKSRALEMVAAWQNSKSAPTPEARIALIEKAIGLARGFSAWPLREPGRDDLMGQMWGQLGNEYMRLRSGQRADAPDRAIAAYTESMKHLTATGDRQYWARAQRGIGLAYLERTGGSRADNVERAIAALTEATKVFTREAAPQLWASLQVSLSKAHWHRIAGSRADNLEASLAAAQNALAVVSREKDPGDWIAAQSALGAAYWARVRGSRADNVEAAIAAYEQGLAAASRERQPALWAGLQDNLGMAYGDRVRGEHSDNVEKALAAFARAGEVFTRDAFPSEWAQLQMNLGNANLNRAVGRPEQNREAAIAAYRQALTVYTAERAPERFARTMLNLGNAYAERSVGDTAGNLEQAIDAYRKSLTVYTRQSEPFKWAIAQYNLGSALLRRPTGPREANLQAAGAALAAALEVHTRATVPWDHMKAAHAAGKVAAARGDWPSALAQFESAMAAYRDLLGGGLDQAEVENVVAEAGELFANAAFAAIERKDLSRALDILEAGKARRLRTVLGLDALALAPADRARLDKLRLDIRDMEARLEAATGADRAAALKELERLRGAVTGIIDAAQAKSSDDANRLTGQALAATLLAQHAAIAAPVVTANGARLLLVTRGANGPALKAIELPGLADQSLINSPGVKVALRVSGWLDRWLDAYGVNWLAKSDKRSKQEIWLDEIGKLGPELWKTVGGALATALETERVPRHASVLWLPQGVLGMVPIRLATDPASGEMLLDRYVLVPSPSLAAAEIARRRAATAAPASLAAIVNPSGDLAFTAPEGAAVASYFAANARSTLGADTADPASVLKALRTAGYWHFATHGIFDWLKPRSSALLLAKGERLTVGRLLDEQNLGSPRLVVLSACETGFYDFQRISSEFVGLPGAFLQAGAAGVVGSLWSVDDVSTALLMVRFYDLHLGQKVAPAAALRQAQLWLRDSTREELEAYVKKAQASGRLPAREEAMLTTALGEAKAGSKPFKHPFYWAAFEFFGA
jgi:tetratricopeptide (TPR) repeat protein